MQRSSESIEGAPRDAAPFEIRPYPGAPFGAEIHGVDLARSSRDLGAAVLEAMHRHKVLVFRDQELADEDFRNFALLFGVLEPRISRYDRGERFPDLHLMTNVAPDGSLTIGHQEPANRNWHTDKSYHRRPSMTTMLYAMEVPDEGGDTEFANMAKAYAALPEATKARIHGLRTHHDWGYAFDGKPGFRKATEEEIRERPPMEQPLVRTHPATGERALYMGYFCADIVGMPFEEGRALLDELTEHATGPDFVMAHKWQKNDVVMWDNRSLLHRGRPYNDVAQPRTILRAVVQGDEPF